MSSHVSPKSLTNQDIHIWQVNLDLPPADLSALAQTLSPDEQQRSQRYYFQRDRHRFIAGRGTLRQILSQYTAQPPQQLQFTYSQKGKPALIESSLQFNVSHSHQLGLIAISLLPIGIDIEHLRPTSVLQLAQRYFHPQEYDFLTSLPIEKQLTTFFQFWTAKEAYLKGTGEGLTGLQQIEVSLTPNQIHLLKPTTNWVLSPFTPSPNYRATIAVLPPNQKSLTYSHLNSASYLTFPCSHNSD